MRDQQPFVYFHTHVIDQAVLDRATTAGRSLEIDISMTEDGSLYVGHPLSFYEFKHQPLPDNLSLETILAAVLSVPDMYVVIDCKDVRALPRVAVIIQQFGTNRVIFHSWIDSLLFKPYPSHITVEPQWLHEDLPATAVHQFQQKTQVPVIASARGLTKDQLEAEGEQIIQNIIAKTKGWVDAVNFNLPNAQAPQLSVMQALLDQGILTWLNIDVVPPQLRPAVYLGMTDHIDQATKPQK